MLSTVSSVVAVFQSVLIGLVIKSTKHQSSAEPLGKSERVEIDDARKDDGNYLASHHYCTENERSKLLDHIVDHHLAEGCANGQERAVKEQLRVASAKGDGRGESVVGQQHNDGKNRAEPVNINHLVVGRHGVALEHFLLECGSKGIKEHVGSHEEEAVGSVSNAGTAGNVSREHENDTASCDGNCNGVVFKVVFFATEKSTHKHNGHHFAALSESLCWKIDEFQSFVLAPGGAKV